MKPFRAFLVVFVLLIISGEIKAQVPTSNLKMHLTADAGIISSGDSVNVWEDQSGEGNDAFQNTLSRRPILVSNSLNGEPVIHFNGSNSYLTLPTATDLGIVSNDYEIFIVSRSASVNTDVNFLLAGNLERYELHINGSAGARFIPKASTYIDEGSIGDYSDTDPHIYNMRATDTYGNITVDAVSSTNSLVDSRSSDTGNLYLGVRFDNSYTLDGDIAEILIYNAVLSTTDRGLLENYLGAKYGIEVPSVTPTVQASDVSISEEIDNSMTVGLTTGNGSNRLIVAKKGSPVDFTPVDGSTYTANSSFESGTELGSGNYVIYNDSGNEVILSSLQENHHYYFAAFEYFGSEGSEKYLTTSPGTGDSFTTGYAFEEISSLAMWLRADAGIADPSNGALVSAWADTAGSAAEATQGSSTLQPVFTTNALNGLPGVSFDGIDNYLTLPTSSALGIQNSDYELFIVAKPANSTNVEFLFGGSATSNYEVHINGGQGIRYIPGGSTYLDAGATGEYSDGDGHIYHMNATSTGGFVQVDGGADASYSSNLQNATNTVLELARRGNNTLYYTGDIYEVLLFNASLSSATRDSITTYLSDKYEISYTEQTTPEIQASNPVFSNISKDQLTLAVNKGDGIRRIVLAKEGSAVDGLPTNSTLYSSSLAFGSGDEIGTGNFVVYAGTDSVITVTGLSQNTEYHFAVFEYNGRVNEEQYLTTNPATNSETTSILPSNITSVSLSKSSSTTAAMSAIIETGIVTNYKVLWGTSSTVFTDSTSLVPGGEGASTDSVSIELTGLSSNTVYYAKLKAINSNETVTASSLIYFEHSQVTDDSLSVWLAADLGFESKSNGDTVSVWYDISGNNNKALVPSSNNKPTLSTNSINGLPVLSMGSTGAFDLPTTGDLGIHNSDYEIFVVAKKDGTDGLTLVGGYNNFSFSLDHNGYAFRFTDFDNFGSNGEGGDLSIGEEGFYSDNNPYVFNLLGSNQSGYVNIDYLTVGSDKSHSFWMRNDHALGLGAGLDNGSRFNYFKGDIAEVIIYRRTLSAAERYDVHSYLSDKYDLDLPLTTPSQSVSDVSLANSGAGSVKITFSPGNGVNNLILLKQGGSVDALPVDDNSYSASTIFGEGDEIGSGNYVVSNNSDSSIVITGLTQGVTYHARVFSFNGEAGSNYEKYFTTDVDTASIEVPVVILVNNVSPAPFSNSSKLNNAITITFSGAMNASSFVTDSSFIVRGSESGLHTGVFEFSAEDKIVTFTSDSSFKAGERVVVNITEKLEGAADLFDDAQVFAFNIRTTGSTATFKKSKALEQGFTAEKTMVSDINRDRRSDIVALDKYSSISVWLADSDSTYATKVNLSVGDSPTNFTIADLDGDGDEDMIMSDNDSYYVKVLYNDGEGSFDSGTNFSLNDYSYTVTAGDLDHDGDLDIVVGISDNVSVLLNDGTGVLSAPADYSIGTVQNVIDVVTTDINGDGELDIVAIDEYSKFYTMINNGDGTFGSPLATNTFDGPSAVDAGDLDNDGDVDLVLSSNTDYNIYVYKNNGDGTFSNHQGYENLGYFYDLKLVDYDGDSDLDIISQKLDQYINIFPNSGDGTFSPYTALDVKSFYVYSLDVSDMDGDGDIDLFISGFDSLYIFENLSFTPKTVTGNEGWRLISSPVGNTAFSDMFSEIWTQGFTGATSEDGKSNVYLWDENSTDEDTTNWVSATAIDDSLRMGSGALIYIFSDDNGPLEEGDTGFPKTLDFSGFYSPVSSYIQLDSLLNPNEDGWALLGNPFFVELDWDDFSTYNLSESVYVWNADSSAWNEWNGSSGDLTGGVIHPYTAFFVQSTDSDPELEINVPSGYGLQNSGGGGGEAKAMLTKTVSFSVKLESESGFSDNAWIQFSENAETGIDDNDAYTLAPLSSSYVSFGSSLADGTLLSINNQPIGKGKYEYPLSVNTTEAGKHQISIDQLSIPEGWEVSLRDIKTDVVTNLVSPHVFTMESTGSKAKISQMVVPKIRKMAKSKTSSRFILTISAPTVNGELVSDLPRVVELEQNYPNPFNPSSVIQFGVPKTSRVNLEVFDLLGRKVATLVNNENRQAGRYSVQFDGRNLASGLYIYRLQVGNTILTKKMTLIK